MQQVTFLGKSEDKARRSSPQENMVAGDEKTRLEHEEVAAMAGRNVHLVQQRRIMQS